MALDDWKAENVVRAWLRANGSDDWPYGDNWRLSLVNPVVFHLASLVQRGFDPKNRDSLYFEIANQRIGLFKKAPDNPKSATHNFEIWHENPFRYSQPAMEQGVLDKVRMLDLGCGEAYRSRWLSRFSIEYFGIDGCEEFIAHAETLRAKHGDRVTHHEYMSQDLTDPRFDFSSLNFSPNLVTAIVLLDHLPNPAPLLRKLSKFLASQTSPAPLLVITLNPRHFKEGLGLAHGVTARDPGEDPDPGQIGTKRRAYIESARSSVSVFYRSLKDWEKIFQDGNFHVLKTSPLQFSDHTIIAKPQGLSTCYEVAPFHAWVLFPKPLPQQATEQDLELLLSIGAGVFNVVDDHKRAIHRHLLENLGSLSTLTLNEKDTLVYADNLGRDVYCLLSGSAALMSKNGIVSQSFQPGTVIGELEAEDLPAGQTEEEAWRYLVRRFILPVEITSDATKLLVLPKEIFQSLLTVSTVSPISHRLFRNLRDNLLTDLWQFYNERDATDWGTAPFRKDYPSLSPNKGRLQPARLNVAAKALMYSATLEAKRNKQAPDGDLDGGIIFVGDEELAHIQDDNPTEIRSHLRFLDGIGVIRCIGLKSYASDGAWVDATKMDEWWKRLRRNAFELLVINSLRSNALDGHAKLESVRQMYPPPVRGVEQTPEELDKLELTDEIFEGVNLNEGSNKKRKAIVAHDPVVRAYHHFVRKICGLGFPEFEVEKSVARWLANIGYVNYYIIKTEHARIIRLVDPHALRRLAFDTGAFSHVFLERFRAFPEIHSSGRRDLQYKNDLDVARLGRYLDITAIFLKSLWAVSSDCDMTASHTHLRYMTDYYDVEVFRRVLQSAK